MIRSSSIHAAGCYTTSPIAKGVQVVEYTGPRISKKEADKRFENSKITYLFGIGDGSTVINGMGVAMYINHSCDPNCETEEVDGRVWIMSIRSIAPGEELTYDYNLVRRRRGRCALPLRSPEMPQDDVFAGRDCAAQESSPAKSPQGGRGQEAESSSAEAGKEGGQEERGRGEVK